MTRKDLDAKAQACADRIAAVLRLYDLDPLTRLAVLAKVLTNDEGLTVPMLVHDPRRRQSRQIHKRRVKTTPVLR